MYQNLTSGEQNLILLDSLIPRDDRFYIWAYSVKEGLLDSSCPEEDRPILDRCFRLFGGMEKLADCAEGPADQAPLLIGCPIGLTWAAVRDQKRAGDTLLLIGPVFYSAPPEDQIRRTLLDYPGIERRMSFISDLMKLCPRLPVMSYAIFTRYVVLVHNTVNARQLSLEDLDLRHSAKELQPSSAEKRDRSRIYRNEQAMLQMVRTGDINYQHVLQNVIVGSPGVPVRGQDPLRQAKTSIIVFTSLVCRAAMEGGLSPEVAYSLGDSYIQSVEDCRDSAELSALAHAMYHDFIYRVHYLHANPHYSHAVQKCCDYIELSLDRKIRASDLASLVGYTEYYLTEKFKKETGLSVSSYIRKARTERARLLLETTDLPIHQISERLAFNAPNYFIQCFREDVGCTPAAYRKSRRQG